MITFQLSRFISVTVCKKHFLFNIPHLFRFYQTIKNDDGRSNISTEVLKIHSNLIPESMKMDKKVQLKEFVMSNQKINFKFC